MASALLLLCLGVARPIRGDTGTETITLGPGLYTFPEIAQALSGSDHPVRCSDRLNNAAAFLCLKARPWSEAVTLLSDGLSVRLVPDDGIGIKTPPPPGSLMLVRDPTVATRERRWLTRFEGNVSHAIQDQFRAFADRVDQSPLIDVAEHDRHIKEWQQLEASIPAGTSPSPDIQKQRDTLREVLNAESQIPQAAQRLSFAWASSHPVPPVSAVAAQPGETTLSEATPVPAEWLPLLQRAVADQNHQSGLIDADEAVVRAADTSQYFLLANWYLSRRCGEDTLSFTPQAWLIPQIEADGEGTETAPIPLWPPGGIALPGTGRKNGVKIPGVVDSIFRGSPDGVDPYVVPGTGIAHLDGLGTDAVAWLEAEQTATANCLAADAAVRAPLKHPLPTQTTALSDALQNWSEQTGAEAVMELTPEAEILAPAGSGKAASSLADWIQAYSGEWGSAPSGASTWSFRTEKKALLVTDRLAFLDRLRPYPMAAFVPLVRARNAATPTEKTRPLPYPLVRDYVLAIAADPKPPRWGDTDASRPDPVIDAEFTYHDISPSSLDAAVPLIFAWEQIPSEQRATLLSADNPKTARQTFPLSQLPAGARARLLALLRAQSGGLAHPRLWLPSGRERLLHSGELQVISSPLSATPETPGVPTSPARRVTLKIRLRDETRDNTSAFLSSIRPPDQITFAWQSP